MRLDTHGIILVVLLLAIAGGGASAASTSPDLTVGILPDVDSIPFVVAAEEGFFADEGVDVRLVHFSNPIERDSALQAKAIDGEVADILAAAFAIDSGLPVKITSITDGRYILLAARDSSIESAADLKGVKIGMSVNTIIEYMTDRMLTAKGLESSEIAKIAVPKIPIRLQMLNTGTIKAACLPDPLATTAILSGARPIMDSATMNIAPGVMVFRQEALEQKANAIAAMYRAYARAVTALNDNPDQYRDILVEKAKFPAQVKDSFVFPRYHLPVLPKRTEVDEVISWLMEKELIKTELAYEQLVTDAFAKPASQ